MKRIFLICMTISAGLFLFGCADLNHGPFTGSSNNSSLPPGASPGLSSGGGTGGGGGHFPTHQEP